MKKIWLLTKIQLFSVMDPKKILHMNTKKHSGNLVITLLALFLIVLFGGFSGMYAAIYANLLKPAGAVDAIPAMWMAATCIITLFTTVYKVKGTLFQFSDYDMVMSLPVPTSGVVASRIFILYLYDLLFTFIILLPGNIVYGIFTKAGVGFYLISTIMLLFVPMIPLLIGTLIGLLVSVAASKFRYSNLVTLVLSIGLFVAYMVANMKTSFSPNQEQVFRDLAKTIRTQVFQIYPLTKMYTVGIVDLNWINLFGFTAISILVFVAFCFLVGKFFKKVNTSISTLKARSNYKFKELKAEGVLTSLYKKELKRFFSSPNYVMNSSVGTLLITVAMILLLFTGKEQLAETFKMPGLADNLVKFVPVLLLFCISMTCTTAASISLEGKNLWIMKSLPISPMQLFLSKIMVNLTVTIPFVILDAIILTICFKMDFLQLIISILLPCAGAVFMSFFGMIMNLRFPRFDWKSEMEVVKQGIPTMVSLFFGMIVGAAAFGLVVLFPKIEPGYLFLAYTVVLSIITVSFYRYLSTKGSNIIIKL